MAVITNRLSPSGDMLFGNGLQDYATGLDAARTMVWAALQIIQGEWFLNTDTGLPYYTTFALRPFPKDTFDSLVKQTILNVPGVDGLIDYNSDLDDSSRNITIIATIQATANQVFELIQSFPIS